jgi:hypothetical protein
MLRLSRDFWGVGVVYNGNHTVKHGLRNTAEIKSCYRTVVHGLRNTAKTKEWKEGNGG